MHPDGNNPGVEEGMKFSGTVFDHVVSLSRSVGPTQSIPGAGDSLELFPNLGLVPVWSLFGVAAMGFRALNLIVLCFGSGVFIWADDAKAPAMKQATFSQAKKSKTVLIDARAEPTPAPNRRPPYRVGSSSRWGMDEF